MGKQEIVDKPDPEEAHCAIPSQRRKLFDFDPAWTQSPPPRILACQRCQGGRINEHA